MSINKKSYRKIIQATIDSNRKQYLESFKHNKEQLPMSKKYLFTLYTVYIHTLLNKKLKNHVDDILIVTQILLTLKQKKIKNLKSTIEQHIKKLSRLIRDGYFNETLNNEVINYVTLIDIFMKIDRIQKVKIFIHNILYN